MCLTPFVARNKKTNESQPVPCGRCPACYKRKVSQWSFRLMQESKRSISSHFITLTYDTTHAPISNNGFLSLSKRDTQLFFKRLRKHPDNRGRTIRYYLVGEYGGKTKRPHYHAIIFNVQIASIQQAWNLGNVHYGEVTGASIGYTLKYMSKGAWSPLHKNDDRLPQFGVMSKKLGENYITEKMVRWHKASKQSRMFCNLTDGRKIAMPRYYKEKIYDPIERKAAGYAARKLQLEQLEKAEKDPMYYRNKFESTKAAFRKMALDSLRNEKI